MSKPDHDPTSEIQAAFSPPPYTEGPEDVKTQEIKCDICDRVFTRSEHLRRHKRAHSAEKPFACLECNKRFARQDILRRHQASHDLKRRVSASDDTRRYSRACFACASARVRCLRGDVCPRCRSRGLQCEYPSRRTHSSQGTSEEGQGDEIMTERDDDESCVITWAGENESNGDVFGSLPKESSWVNHLLLPTTSTSTSVGHPWNGNGADVAPAETNAVQTFLSASSPMSTRDWLLGQGIISPDTTIIAGAQLVPHVSEGNIGSLYNYSRINWLPPNDLAHADRSFRAPSLQSPVAIPSQVAIQERSDAQMYYVDGDGAAHHNQNGSAMPFYGGQSISSISPTLEKTHTHLSFEYPEAHIWVAEESYVALTDYLKYTSRRDISLSHTDSLPSLKELNEYARLYFEKFHESFPLLHKTTFLNNRDGCLLELAIAAIGACYAATMYARKCSESLHELVNKLLEIATSSDYNPSEFPGVFGLRRPGYPQRPTRLQARILNVLGMFHSGNPKLASLAREGRAILVTTCIESKMLMTNHYDGWEAASSSEEEGERFLQQWLEGELRCRAGYFVWMLDCMMAYESDFRTHMDLLDGKAPLPCPEQIWDEAVINKAPLLILNSGPPSLCLALDVLYTEKRLVPNLGELSRILLIHGMYRRVWEVARYQTDILSDWVPTALSEPHHGITSEKTATPPSSSVVSRWTNGSCDCLDILHWSAKSRILQYSGLEHPTILHLHLSRLILLAPVSDLQELARAKYNQEAQRHSESYLDPVMQEQELRTSLHQWVMHDQYKARLAMIHAGSVFWYLRRYNCESVIEPFACYLATLVLWSYSVSFSSVKLLNGSSPETAIYESHRPNETRTSRASDVSHHNPHEDHRLSAFYSPPTLHSQISNNMEQLESHETSIIQLDRPCDDEIVQLFVRFGEKMTPYLARIGDMKARGSAGKVLREGIRVLSCQDNHGLGSRRRRESEGSVSSTWGVSENFIEMLAALGATP